MSGIAGIIGKTDKERAAYMLDKIAHRGPASRALFVGDGVVFCQNWHQTTKKTGKQISKLTTKGNLTIVFDGFLTNRDEFNIPGSDAEIVLSLYQRYKEDCVEMLKGMFAFALLDKNRVLLARDPFGIRPLYLGWDDEAIYFASEIKALIFAKSIDTFPPGRYSWFDPRKKMAQPWYIPYFQLNLRIGERSNSTSVAKRLRALLDKNISACLRQNEHVGSLLSGGIDSSVVTAFASKIAKELGLSEWHTYCIGTANSDDLKYAALVAEDLGTVHHEYILEEKEVEKLLPTIVYHLESFDAPLVRSSVSNYLIAREAKCDCCSLLCGEGGDELFAGYEFLDGLTTSELLQETVKMIDNSHNTALQRDDRMTACHGLGNRVPFFSTELVDFALGIDQRLKRRAGVEKYILRKSVEKLLPEAIVWRPKAKFWSGSGSEVILKGITEGKISDKDFASAKEKSPHIGIKTKEELAYFNIFKEHFPANVIEHVGRTQDWRPR
jgi:asparagine synthase (glutamine-hydrolysing)